MNRINEGDPLIFMPAECLLPTGSFDFDLDGATLSAIPVSATLSDRQKKLMKLMMTLFSMGDRVHYHTDSSPWSMYRKCSAVFDKLLAARNSTDYSERIAKLKNSGKQFRIYDFLKSRTLGFKRASDVPPEPVIMPVIEFANHHHAGSPFNIPVQDGRSMGMVMRKHACVTGSSECFSCYGPYDALDTYLNYGFVDTSVPYVRSVPIRIRLKGLCTLHVGTTQAPVRKEMLPPHLLDLAMFLPMITPRKGSAPAMDIAPLFISSDNDALRRVLVIVADIICENFAGAVACRDRSALLQEMERQLVSKNLEYYRQLGSMVGRMSDDDPCRGHREALMSLVATQIRIIEGAGG